MDRRKQLELWKKEKERKKMETNLNNKNKNIESNMKESIFTSKIMNYKIENEKKKDETVKLINEKQNKIKIQKRKSLGPPTRVPIPSYNNNLNNNNNSDKNKLMKKDDKNLNINSNKHKINYKVQSKKKKVTELSLDSSGVFSPINNKSNITWQADDFIIGKRLGKGKFGNVYLAECKKTGVIVALKILFKNKLLDNKNSKINLKREIEIQSRLKHPNILALYGYFVDNKNIYLVLEYAEKGGLHKLLEKKTPINETKVIRYVKQIARALQYCHECNVIHRDIKPENILLSKNDQIKLADFGCSIVCPKPFNRRRSFCGTPEYLSPDIIQIKEKQIDDIKVKTENTDNRTDNETYDKEVDLWSLGILIFEMLYGSRPFAANTIPEIYTLACHADIIFPPNVLISETAKDIIKGLLKKNPKERLTIEDVLNNACLLRDTSNHLDTS